MADALTVTISVEAMKRLRNHHRIPHTFEHYYCPSQGRLRVPNVNELFLQRS